MNQIFPVNSTEVMPILGSDERIRSLNELRHYRNKVVKFTSDWGKTFQYFYIDEYFYKQNQDILGPNEVIGIKCFSEKKLWNDRLVGVNALFTKDSFTEGPYFNNPQSYFELASYSEFSDRTFMGIAGSGQLPEEAASKPCSRFPGGLEPFICRAPLTLIRSEKPSQVAVSILFDLSRFVPREPTFPCPSEQVQKFPEKNSYSPTFWHTWNIQSQENGTLSIDGADQKVKMIWWEAVRKTAPIPFNPDANSVTVSRYDLFQTLHSILAKKGVSTEEAHSFAVYWGEAFQLDFDEDTAPFVTVELVEESDLNQFLPLMTAESPDANFEVKRFYFRFQPTEEKKGKELPEYLETLQPSSFGPNAVIDLGGEMVPSKHPRKEKSDQKEFIENFIDHHVKA